MEKKDIPKRMRTVKTNICQTGGKKLKNRFVNEDIMTFGDKYSFVMDGATGLGGPESINGWTSAEWYVQLVSKFLVQQLQDESKDIKQIVTNAINYATSKIREYERTHNMHFKDYEEPSSSLVLYRELEKEGKKRFQIFALGDSSAIISYKDGTVTSLANPNEIKLKQLDRSVLERMVEIASKTNQTVIETRSNPEIQRMLEINRGKKNTEGGYWILGTNAEAVEHAAIFEDDLDKIESVLLHTDGFNYKMLGMNKEELMETCKSQFGIEMMQRKIREAEEKDETCNRYPRFKQHDDMAAVNNIRQRLIVQEIADKSKE